MSFFYRFEKCNPQVWSGALDSAHCGSFIGDVPQSFAKEIGQLRALKQVHGSVIYDDFSYQNDQQEGDGLLSRETGIALTIRTADCSPAFFAQGDQIALIHAGWRSARAGILQKSLACFDLERVNVVIGPSIFCENYEVDRDLYESWEDPDLGPFLIDLGRGSRRQFDLRGFARHVLIRSGLGPNQIYQIPLCTYRDQLPSYRRNGQKAGRLVHYIHI